jgi:hypothetical protein
MPQACALDWVVLLSRSSERTENAGQGVSRSTGFISGASFMHSSLLPQSTLSLQGKSDQTECLYKEPASVAPSTSL